MLEAAGRLYLGKDEIDLEPLDLIAVQRQSFAEFLETGIANVIAEISPADDFTGKNFQLKFGKISLGTPDHTPAECLEKGLTYDAPLKVEAKLVNKATGESAAAWVFLCDLPLMLDKGSFIINGIERAIVNQLVRAPGVYFSGEVDPVTGKMLYNAEIRPVRGSWLEFTTTRQGFVTVKIDRRRKFAATTILRAVGISSDEEILTAFKSYNFDLDFIEKTIERDPTKSTDEALLEIFRKLRPGDPAIVENARSLIDSIFFAHRRYHLGPVGRFKINKKLAKLRPAGQADSQVLTLQDLIGTIAYLILLTKGVGKVDDIDHLANRRLRRVGELIAQNAFRVGMLRLERVVKERMSLVTPDTLPSPATLINARPVISAVNEFFRTSQLSTILDQTNPLSELDNLRRISVMGIGGITKERASFSIRDINHSQYSRIDPIRSPEGPSIGLVTYLALYSKVNSFGFLEAPYRKVVQVNGRPRLTNEIVFLAADDEEGYFITHASVEVSKDGEILGLRVPARFGGEFITAPASAIQFVDVVPRQIVGTSASLIPFLAHDEANRALMGTHMQCQAVPLVKPEPPLVGTGMEKVVAENSGKIVAAPGNGAVKFADATRVEIELKHNGKSQNSTFEVKKFVRSPQSTCFSQRPVVSVGDRVKKGQILIDGPAMTDGELALGTNLLIAYSSFEGLGYEDAIVISDRLVKDDSLTSIHIEEHDTAVVDTKLGPEETTRDIPNVAEEDLANLDSEGIVVIGAEVGPNDILVGKIAPKGETELTAEERLLRAIFGEKAREVRDTSLRMPHGERGTVIDIKILSRAEGDELEPGTLKKIIVKVAQLRKVVVGDKLAGRHGNKGVISKIVPASDMPYLADGSPVDIIISPLSVLSRMNLGQLLEAHLGWALEKLGLKIAIPVFEKLPEDEISKYLEKAGLPAQGKVTLFDGRTGAPFDNPSVVGRAYIMKLIHMVEDKTHARSTGPYSLITQQPLGGKAQMGGQRLGEMEVWALESYGAAHTLQEMLTIKSDDVVGRAKAFEAIIKGTDIPKPAVPESYKVLVKELNSLGLNVEPIGVSAAQPEAEEADLTKVEKVVKEARELAVESGATVVATGQDLGAQSGVDVVEVKD